MLPSAFAAEQFNRTLESERAWSSLADCQLRACEILFETCWRAKQQFDQATQLGQTEFVSGPDIELVQTTLLYPQVSLLAGLAVENMLKGLWVLRNQSGLRTTSELPKPLRTHNVATLAEKLALELDEKEIDCLRHLSQMSKWQGKYRIPLGREENCSIYRKWINPDLLFSEYKKQPNSAPQLPDEFVSVVKKIDLAIHQARQESTNDQR